MRVDVTVDISAPPEVVWAILRDVGVLAGADGVDMVAAAAIVRDETTAWATEFTTALNNPLHQHAPAQGTSGGDAAA